MNVPSFRLTVSRWLDAWTGVASSRGATLHVCEVSRMRGRIGSRWLVSLSAPWIHSGVLEFSGNRRAVHGFLCSSFFGHSFL